ncbi:hypothetical protein COCCADRAFT_113122 [Bipolaris zeicola 26-R-13]|uniref:Uncharacterized protein n=1 Tax=Cochliobolus carbonum (strain 26-R-13) TaxID=930089 RepID=W6XVS2_COCC2|nr:uncharacterized protein COCCADRAFT_113122 [Bipolaris zeicola 26-R-13]EUC26879.1 hypothetical protein COCCADRAFT_113122 [Bipolaris zeicola 26-R-13]
MRCNTLLQNLSSLHYHRSFLAHRVSRCIGTNVTLRRETGSRSRHPDMLPIKLEEV